jgi:hypothetical protein
MKYILMLCIWTHEPAPKYRALYMYNVINKIHIDIMYMNTGISS